MEIKANSAYSLKLKLKLSLAIENSWIFHRFVGTIGPIAEPAAPLHSNRYKLCKEELSENIYKLSSRTNYIAQLPEQRKKTFDKVGLFKYYVSIFNRTLFHIINKRKRELF